MKKSIITIVFLMGLLFLFNGISLYTLAEENNKVIDDTLFSKIDKDYLNVYFYDLGTRKNGDSFIITIEDVQILVDAGADISSKEHIIQNMEKILETDVNGVWEYAIFTHHHKDHIINASDVFDFFIKNDDYSLGNIIDFDKAESLSNFAQSNTDLSESDYEDNTNEKNYYDRYVSSRTKIISSNEGTKHYSARDLTEGGKTYTFSQPLANDTYLTILYNYYYDNPCTEDNEISVCFMITKGKQKFLFTGDLEKSGEEYLIENNKKIDLPNGNVTDLENVTLFKAGHHGSRGSNTEKFINHIRPNNVVISCSADTTEYPFGNVTNRFPSMTAMNNFFKYTDHIYITNHEILKDGQKSYEPYHGNILFLFDGEDSSVYSTNNSDTNSKVAKDIHQTKWFMENRTESVYIYTFDEPLNSYASCSLIKYGHYEILIDCGSSSQSYSFVDEIKKYCVDGKLEYIVLTHGHYFNFNQIVSNNLKTGILENFNVGEIIDFSPNITSAFAENTSKGLYSKYVDYVEKNKINKNLEGNFRDIIPGKISMQIIRPYNVVSNTDDSYSITTIVKFYDEKFLFVGDQHDFEYLVENYSSNIINSTFYKASNSYSFDENYKSFLKKIYSGSYRPYTVIGTSLNYRNTNGDYFGEKDYCDFLLKYLKDKNGSYVYPTSYIDNRGMYKQINGNITFRLSYTNEINRDVSLTGQKGAIFLENSEYYKSLLKNK